MNPKVIGISGVTGAGKSTLVKKLSSMLDNTALYWDDFDEISIAPIDYVDWFKRGQNYNEWDYQTLANVLKSLKAGQPTSHPTQKYILYPTKYIIFDAPLGYLHSQTGQYLDLCFHIEVPLDVSLSRRLLRDFKGDDKTKEELLAELKYYLSDLRPLFFDDALKRNANFIIDGMLSTEDQVDAIKGHLR